MSGFLKKLGGFINSEMKRSINKMNEETNQQPKPPRRLSLLDYEEFLEREPTDDQQHEHLVHQYDLVKSRPVITPSDLFTGKTMWKVFQQKAWDERKDLFEKYTGRKYK